MKKSILAVAVLSMFAGVSQADSIDGGTAAGVIDLFQVGATTETDSGVGITSLSQTAAGGSIALIQGNVVDNITTIGQAGASTANVSINAQLPDNTITGGGDRTTGAITDVTLAIAGAAGSATDPLTAAGGTTNTITVAQAADGEVLNMSVDGTSNQVNVSQTLAASIVNVVQHGDLGNITISQ